MMMQGSLSSSLITHFSPDATFQKKNHTDKNSKGNRQQGRRVMRCVYDVGKDWKKSTKKEAINNVNKTSLAMNLDFYTALLQCLGFFCFKKVSFSSVVSKQCSNLMQHS